MMSVGNSTWLNTDGVRFEQPEIVLAHKARWRNPKDDEDFIVTWPRLDEPAQRWLHEQVERMYPGHDWLRTMARRDQSKL